VTHFAGEPHSESSITTLLCISLSDNGCALNGVIFDECVIVTHSNVLCCGSQNLLT